MPALITPHTRFVHMPKTGGSRVTSALVAAGGALGLLWRADVTIVVSDARPATGFVELGLSGDLGSWWLRRLVGIVRAKELLLGGRVLSGSEAAEWGLVTAALPAGEVEAHAGRTARALAARPAVAAAEIKGLLTNAFGRDLGQAFGAEQDAMLRTAATGEALKLIAQFGRE
jgi:2-(1,2-epoxy-1,2-dihydrophenyl)acetyl-CoA isomerase